MEKLKEKKRIFWKVFLEAIWASVIIIFFALIFFNPAGEKQSNLPEKGIVEKQKTYSVESFLQDYREAYEGFHTSEFVAEISILVEDNLNATSFTEREEIEKRIIEVKSWLDNNERRAMEKAVRGYPKKIQALFLLETSQ
ncbi:hypothetical protein B6U91_01440 [Candidatus Pacearchaeota archaeon ex4484_71]|nr:MAG: hypothetical protein B6U91_01440 [Candidatus Pacearchaeota archaeon ex4484_71]